MTNKPEQPDAETWSTAGLPQCPICSLPVFTVGGCVRHGKPGELENIIESQAARIAELEGDAKRMDWLAAHIHGVDFDYGPDHLTVVTINWPKVAVGCSLRENVDDAIRAALTPKGNT